MPADYFHWMRVHAGVTPLSLYRCGWGFRGVFAASRGAILRRPPAYYARLEAELGRAVFPVAGMYQERLWRRILYC